MCYLGHVLMDNHHGLIVDTRTTQANGKAERESALDVVEARPGKSWLTVGAWMNGNPRRGVADW